MKSNNNPSEAAPEPTISGTAETLSRLLGTAVPADFSKRDTEILDSLCALIASRAPSTFNDIHMAGDRAIKFRWMVHEISDCVVSLESSTSSFPGHTGLSAGDVDPAIAVEAFTAAISKRLDTMYTMLASEDKEEVSE